MTEQEVEIINEQIELHNKFCFIKKQVSKYKKVVPLSHVIIYFLMIVILLALPTWFDEDRNAGIFSKQDSERISLEMKLKRINFDFLFKSW